MIEEFEQLRTTPRHRRRVGFNANTVLASLNGQIIEIAGPTNPNPFTLLLPSDSGRKIYISNKYPQYRKIDFYADATRLPFADDSLVAIMGSALLSDIRVGAIKEANRILKPGGLLFWNFVDMKVDAEAMAQSSLEVMETINYIIAYHCILQKPV